MAKLELTLHTDDGDVIYQEQHVSGQKYLDLMNMKLEFENTPNITVVDVITKRVEYTASLFTNNSVKTEAVLKGTDPWELENMLNRIEMAVLGIEPGDEKKEV